MNVEQIINVLEILHRKRNALVPDIEIFLVATLELYQFLAASFPHRGIGGGFRVRLLINTHNFGQWIALKRVAIEQVFPGPDHHSKLGAPIANMIVADY